jgi:hypothetical protein
MINNRSTDLKKLKYFAIILILLGFAVPLVKADIYQATYNVNFYQGDGTTALEAPIHILLKGKTGATWTDISDVTVNTGQTTLSFSTETYTGETMLEIINPAGWTAESVINSVDNGVPACAASLNKTQLTCPALTSGANVNVIWRFTPNPTSTPTTTTAPTPTGIACSGRTTVHACDESDGACAWFFCANGGNGACFTAGTSQATACPSPTPSNTPVPKPRADADNDGEVDDDDYAIMQSHFLESLAGLSSVGDFSHDGKVNGIDYVIWMKTAKK